MGASAFCVTVCGDHLSPSAVTWSKLPRSPVGPVSNGNGPEVVPYPTLPPNTEICLQEMFDKRSLKKQCKLIASP